MPLAFAVMWALMMPGISPAYDNYGAIAFSRSDNCWGWSYDWGSRGAAEAEALSNCRQRGGGCQVVLWFKSSCGALAVGSNRAYGYAWNDSKGAAIDNAIEQCRRHGGRGCEMKCWACTRR